MSYLPELRRALVRAAHRQAAAPDAPGAPAHARRPTLAARAWQAIPVVPAVGVTVAVVVVALGALGHGGAGHSTPAGGPPPGLDLRNLTPTDRAMLSAAARRAQREERSCVLSPAPVHLPDVNQGAPSANLLSLLGVLRRPATSADRPAGLLNAGPIPDVYVHFVRLATTIDGWRIFVIPSADVNAGGSLTPRCAAAEAAALRHELAGVPAAHAAALLRLQAHFLALDVARPGNPEGVCLAAAAPASGAFMTLTVSCGYTAAQIHAGAVAAGDNGVRRGFLYGVVPDGVATVTLVYGRSPTVTIHVVNNVYAHTGPSASPTVILRAADGRSISVVTPPYASGGSGFGFSTSMSATARPRTARSPGRSRP